jgi:hypothetical protein
MSLDAYVDANAQGAKIYWAMWGPIGQPAIDALEVLERTQHRYLEQLRDAVQARIEARSRSSGRSTGGVGTPLFTQA